MLSNTEYGIFRIPSWFIVLECTTVSHFQRKELNEFLKHFTVRNVFN